MRNHLITIALVGTMTLCSCSDWFDVSPKTDVKAAELFESEDGFMEALAGIYVSMTDDAAYGDNLSFGMLDQMAQLYDMIPDGATDRSEIYDYTNTTSGGYNTKGKLADSWGKAYNIIANANNLLKWLDEKGVTVITNEQTRNMIRGEALAIRAYVHFDVLRGWGPIYSENPSAKCMPYRTTADKEKMPLLPANEVAEKIIADLTEAKDLLSYESTLSLGETANLERRYRFNYHAVNAELARVYCYIGEAEKAANAAREVINSCGLELQVTNSNDPVLFSETLCGLYFDKMLDNFSSKFSEGPKFMTQYYSNNTTLNLLFESQGSSADVDMRARTSAILRYADQQLGISRKYIRNDNYVIPLIRLPEMYYILCECSSLSDAPQYINLVRQKRGFTNTANYDTFASDEARTTALDKEYRKEFYAEGQYFWFLKRNKMTSFINSAVDEMGTSQYVFPLPDNEKEYGWTSDDDTTSDDTSKSGI